MDVYLLIREDRHHDGYIDTFIVGVYQELKCARLERMRQRKGALAEGLDMNDDNPRGDTWEVYWKIEEIVVE